MSFTQQFHEVSAFTRKGTTAIGNPATICLVKEFPDDKAMCYAAKELGRPMTSFVRYTEDPEIFDIRHFSPDGVENHVCGHATVAASELLARQHPELRQSSELTFRLNPKYGINADSQFKALIKGNDISLTMPAVTELEQIDDPEFYSRLADALRIDENKIVKPAYYVPRIINYVVALKDQQTLLNIKPDFAKLKTLAQSKEFQHEGIMATTKSEMKGFDILTRVFMPVIDVDEDIACGSSNCSVVPYWATVRKGAFAPDKKDFKVLFPYPPRLSENLVGGIQDLSLDIQKETIVLTGQATYKQELSLDLSPAVPKTKPPNGPV